MTNKTVKRIILFASGSGTNVENIINFFAYNVYVKVIFVITNNPKAPVLKRTKKLKIPSFVFSKNDLYNENLLRRIKTIKPDLIVLAGFLLKLPFEFIKSFPKKIINLHPSLLPKYGGKGMYGINVHKCVKDAGETETGITIHYVNEIYDKGEIIFQAKTQLSKKDNIEQIAEKVKLLEYTHLPQVINKIINS
tara:strand:- start:48 stop:626 length:579 start_codon:yes stop_codon:yes gene_type:complete